MESEFIFEEELIRKRVQFKWLFQSLLNGYHGSFADKSMMKRFKRMPLTFKQII